MKKQLMAAVAATMCLAVACTKAPLNNLSAEESRVYVTQRDPTADFKTFTTFSVADSAISVSNGRASLQRSSLDAEYIAALRAGLRSRGFQEVSRTQNPDLGFQINRIVSTQTGYVAVDDYWGFYDDFYGPGYWGPGWSGAGFGPGWGGVVQYQVAEGLISIDALALRNNNGGAARAVWNGSVRGSGSFDAGWAAQSVEALLNQSPYLSRN